MVELDLSNFLRLVRVFILHQHLHMMRVVVSLVVEVLTIIKVVDLVLLESYGEQIENFQTLT